MVMGWAVRRRKGKDDMPPLCLVLLACPPARKLFCSALPAQGAAWLRPGQAGAGRKLRAHRQADEGAEPRGQLKPRKWFTPRDARGRRRDEEAAAARRGSQSHDGTFSIKRSYSLPLSSLDHHLHRITTIITIDTSSILLRPGRPSEYLAPTQTQIRCIFTTFDQSPDCLPRPRLCFTTSHDCAHCRRRIYSHVYSVIRSTTNSCCAKAPALSIQRQRQ